MRSGNPKSAIVAAFGAFAFCVTLMALILDLPSAIVAFYQHLQNPTFESTVMGVEQFSTILLVLVPAGIIGIILALAPN